MKVHIEMTVDIDPGAWAKRMMSAGGSGSDVPANEVRKGVKEFAKQTVVEELDYQGVLTRKVRNG